MVSVRFQRTYYETLNELLEGKSELSPEINKKIKWFRRNPNDTRLDNHPLTKRLEGKFAFSIDDDIRIVYEWIGMSTVRFLAIGRHTKVYSKKQN